VEKGAKMKLYDLQTGHETEVLFNIIENTGTSWNWQEAFLDLREAIQRFEEYLVAAPQFSFILEVTWERIK